MILLPILEQSFAFLPFSLGMYISYIVLDKADLTVDGSFVLGAAVFALTLLSGGTLSLAFVLAGTAGGVAGGAVALLQRRDRMAPLLSGILALFMLQSVNLALMGRPNLNLIGQDTLISCCARLVGSEMSTLCAMGTVSLGLLATAIFLMKSRLGLFLRAFGDNAPLMDLMGHQPESVRFLGLALSNGLVAVSGALIAQSQGYVDIGMGTGNVLIGIGTVIIGRQALIYLRGGKQSGLGFQLVACLLGTITYFSVVHGLVALGVHPIYLKLAIGVAIASLLLSQRPSMTQEATR